MVLQGDGRILVAGTSSFYASSYGEISDIVLVRFLGIDSPNTMIEALVGDVCDYTEDELLNHGQAKALKAKLEGALAKLDKGHVGPALNELQAFVNHVQGFVNGRVLGPFDGQPLITQALTVIVLLSPS
jgi:hypothetical protein